MNKKYSSITFKAKVKPIKPVNPEFDLVKIYVQGVGKNRNGSYMSKENIEKALPTLNYCPVVGHIIEYTDNDGNKRRYIGGHDYEIDDNWEFKNLTVPYGVVVENSYDWETVNEYGTDVEYLTANAILWTGRYPELKECIYSDDTWFNQSMEINIGEGKYRPLDEDSNYTEFLEWDYSALCLLGKADENSTNGHTDSSEHTEPCFISSRVLPVEFEKSEFEMIMTEMKQKLSQCFDNQSSNSEVDNKDKIDGKEDEVVENKKKEEVIETVEEVNEESTEEVVENTTEETPDAEVNEDTNTESENEEVQEDETVVEASVEETVEETVEMSELDSLKAEYEEYKNSHSHTNEEFDELQRYHDNAEFEKIHAERETMLSDEKYSVLAENEAFAELKKNMDNYSLADLEKEAKVIFADYVSSVGTFSMNDSNKKSTSKIRFSMKKDTGKTKAYSTLFK